MKRSTLIFSLTMFVAYAPLFIVITVFKLPAWAGTILSLGMLAASVVTGCYYAGGFDGKDEPFL